MSTETTHSPQAAEAPVLLARPTPLRLLRDQRKILFVGVGFMVAALWVLGPLGEWETAAMVAAGVALALVNHLATEYWLARLISSGEQPTRQRIAAATSLRLLALSVVAVGVAVLFWPAGIGLLLGLAIFRLITLVMTTIPLLKELKAQ